MSIGYAFRPRLRTRLTLGGRTFPRYSHRHSHFLSVQHSSRYTFTPIRTLPYHLILTIKSTATVSCLAPVHFRRSVTRLVSYYALFKGWLLLSQPPSCFDNSTSSFPLNMKFGTLAGDLDSFLLAYGRYHPYTDSCVYIPGIRSLIEFSTPIRRHHSFSALPPGCLPRG